MAEKLQLNKNLSEAKTLLEDYLYKKKLRRTKQRETILQAFLKTNRHISVEELYNEIKPNNPDIGHATVYRSINLFVEAGIAKERRFNEGRMRFEPDVNSEHHDHFICTECGDIEEFEDSRIERLQEEIAAARNFTVESHRLELYGLCQKCSGV
jgi:Fur family ferric uptake transcriptional regulator